MPGDPIHEVRREKHQCRRCGECCWNVGRNFWKHSKSLHPLLDCIADDIVPADESRPCAMLIWKGKHWLCAIEMTLGKKWKPEACRDYPFDGELCFRETKESND